MGDLSNVSETGHGLADSIEKRDDFKIKVQDFNQSNFEMAYFEFK